MEQHEEKLKVESYIRIENFGICMKSTKGFEQGKMFFCDTHLSTAFVFIIPTFEVDVQTKFYHVDYYIKIL